MKKKRNYEVHELVCEYCGKKIISLSESQADYNMKAHKIICVGDTKKVDKK